MEDNQQCSIGWEMATATPPKGKEPNRRLNFQDANVFNDMRIFKCLKDYVEPSAAKFVHKLTGTSLREDSNILDYTTYITKKGCTRTSATSVVILFHILTTV